MLGLGTGGARLTCIGHAGASALAPPNTLDSFALAASLGADVVEFDVRLFRGRLLLAHTMLDARLRPCLTLERALEWLARETTVQLMADLKTPGTESPVVEGLRRHGLLDRAIVTSQRRGVLRRVRELEPRLRVAISIAGRLSRRVQKWDVWRDEVVAAVRDGHYDAVMVHRRLIDAPLVERMRDAETELHAWTARAAGDVAALARLGVHGIVTADPRLIPRGTPADTLVSAGG